MKKFAVVFVVSLFFASLAYAESAVSLATPEVPASDVAATHKYFCPMDGFTSDKPGKCAKCGMDLIEMPADVTATTETATPAAE